MLQVLGESIEIQNETRLRGDILPDLVDDEDNVFLARLESDELDHLLGALVLGFCDMQGEIGEIGRGFENIRIKLRSQRSRHLVRDERLVVRRFPFGAAKQFFGPVLECGQLSIQLQFPLQLGNLEIFGVASPLKNLQIKHGRNVLHRSTGKHLAG